MIKVFFDWEFWDDGEIVHPISYGVVTEDGREYYAETPDAREQCQNDQFLIDEVLPHLDGQNVRTMRQMGEDVRNLLRGSRGIRFWGWFTAWDWYLTCRTYGRMLDCPLGHRANDLAQEAERLKVRLGSRTPRHKAIECARWTRNVYGLVFPEPGDTLIESIEGLVGKVPNPSYETDYEAILRKQAQQGGF